MFFETKVYPFGIRCTGYLFNLFWAALCFHYVGSQEFQALVGMGVKLLASQADAQLELAELLWKGIGIAVGVTFLFFLAIAIFLLPTILFELVARVVTRSEKRQAALRSIGKDDDPSLHLPWPSC